MNTSYTFYMDSDDGAQLYIDGTLLIDKGGAHAGSSDSAGGPRDLDVRNAAATALCFCVIVKPSAPSESIAAVLFRSSALLSHDATAP